MEAPAEAAAPAPAPAPSSAPAKIKKKLSEQRVIRAVGDVMRADSGLKDAASAGTLTLKMVRNAVAAKLSLSDEQAAELKASRRPACSPGRASRGGPPEGARRNGRGVVGTRTA